MDGDRICQLGRVQEGYELNDIADGYAIEPGAVKIDRAYRTVEVDTLCALYGWQGIKGSAEIEKATATV